MNELLQLLLPTRLLQPLLKPIVRLFLGFKVGNRFVNTKRCDIRCRAHYLCSTNVISFSEWIIIIVIAIFFDLAVELFFQTF